MHFIFIIYSLLKSEHLYIVKLQGIAIKYIGMIFSQFIAIYISIEMFYIWYYKHKYCINYGNQFILKPFEFFSKNYNSNIFFNLIHTYYNNNNIHFRNIAMIKKNVLLRPKLQRCSPHSNDSYQCPILAADFVIFCYGIENGQAIQAGVGSEWEIEIGCPFSIP